MVERRRDRVGHVKRVGYVKNSIIGKRKCTRRIKRRPAQAVVPMALQELFLSCLDVFKGPGTVPPTHDVQKLRRILGTFYIRIGFS